jgi:hypothetical protein
MPQAMEFNRPHSRLLDKSQILVLTDVIHLEWMPEGITMPPQLLPFLGEHKPMVMIVGVIRELQFGLMGFMLAE